MTTKVTEETRKEKKSTPEKMLGWFILAPVLLIAVAIIIAVWPKDSTKEVQKVTPVVAQRVDPIVELCGKDYPFTAPAGGEWSKIIRAMDDCNFVPERVRSITPLPALLANLNGLVEVRINGDDRTIKPDGRLPDGTVTAASFSKIGRTIEIRSTEAYPIYFIAHFLPQG